MQRPGRLLLAARLLFAAGLAVMQERLVERPHIFSFAGEVGLLLAFERLEARAACAACAVPPARQLFKLAAGTSLGVALWANLHAGVFIAPVLLALYALGARL